MRSGGRQRKSTLPVGFDIKCSCCGETKNSKEYYNSSSPFYKDTGKYNVCKQCIFDFVVGDSVDYSLEKVKSALRMMDKPFYSDIWESSEKEAEKRGNTSTFGTYMKNIAMKDYKEANWSHSVDNMRKDPLNAKIKDSYKYTKEDLRELISFFGKGYTTDEYIRLNNEFKDFKARHKGDSKSMDLLIKQIVIQELDIERRREAGEKVDSQLKTLQDLLGSSSLKPVQDNGGVSDQETFGTLIKKWENEHPIPEPDEQWKDVDGIGKYMRVFFTGHLANMLGKLDGSVREEYEEEIAKHTVEEPEIEDGDEDVTI